MVSAVQSLLVLLSLSWSVVGECIVPATLVCNITHLVPPSVAALSGVFESEISSAYNSDKDQGISEECAQWLKEVRCAKSFPRCSNDSTNVTVTSLDCLKRLQCATSTYINILTRDHFCDLAEETFPLAGCKPATQYGYTFGFCPQDVYSMNVSQWMFALLRYQDLYLSAAVAPNGFLAQNYPNCAASYAHYRCARIGRCDGCGTDSNIIVNNAYTQDECSALQNLFTSCSSYVPIADCKLWPSEAPHLPCNMTSNSTSVPTSSAISKVANTTAMDYSRMTSNSEALADFSYVVLNSAFSVIAYLIMLDRL